MRPIRAISREAYGIMVAILAVPVMAVMVIYSLFKLKCK